MYSVANKIVLVTGASGTVGRSLIKKLLNENPKFIYAIDHYEQGIFELEMLYCNSDHPVIPLVADIRDQDRMMQLISEVDIVIHGAAIKHVPIAERTPFDAVSTNIIGTKNVLSAALKHNVDRVLFMSSDKAVNPTNVMGSTKILGEKMTSALMNTNQKNNKTIFFSTRFGNVIGSNGSVTNLFTQQILSGHPVTVTSKEMTRFIMTVDEAVGLLIESLKRAKGGEVFVMKMPSVQIEDLAIALINKFLPDNSSPNKKIKYIGPRPGEKMYEELISDEEARRTYDEGNFFVIRPAFDRVFSHFNDSSSQELHHAKKRKEIKNYRSDQVEQMTKDEINQFLSKHNLLEKVQK